MAPMHCFADDLLRSLNNICWMQQITTGELLCIDCNCRADSACAGPWCANSINRFADIARIGGPATTSYEH